MIQRKTSRLSKEGNEASGSGLKEPLTLTLTLSPTQHQPFRLRDATTTTENRFFDFSHYSVEQQTKGIETNVRGLHPTAVIRQVRYRAY